MITDTERRKMPLLVDIMFVPCLNTVLILSYLMTNIKKLIIKKNVIGPQYFFYFQTSVEKILPLPPVDNGNSCLIPIYVQMIKKGNIKRHSLICLPIGTDVTSINTLLEPLHKDYNEDKRRLFRKEHKKAIKSLRRKRRKFKEKMVCVYFMYINFTSNLLEECFSLDVPS